MIATLLQIALMLTLAVPGGDTVTLRPWAEIATGSGLTVGHVAEVTGPQREAIAAVTINADVAAGAWTPIGSDLVRRAIDEAAGLRAGAVEVRTGVCSVRVGAVRLAPAEPVDAVRAPAFVSGPTIRDAVTAQICRLLNESPHDARIEFDAADAELLDRAHSSGTLTLDISGRSERLAVHVRIFDGPTLLTQTTVRVRVTARRDVAVPTRAIARQEQVRADSIVIEERWLPLTVRPAGVRAVIGAVARNRLDAGDFIREGDVEMPLAAKKGHMITVHCLSGSFSVRVTARALASGRVGDTIACQMPGASGQFDARLDAEGRAVALAGAEHEADPAGSAVEAAPTPIDAADPEQPAARIPVASEQRSRAERFRALNRQSVESSKGEPR